NYLNYLKSGYSNLSDIENRNGPYSMLPQQELNGLMEEQIGILQSLINENDDFYLNQHYLGLNIVLSDIWNFLDLKTIIMTSLPDFDVLIYQEAQFNLKDNFNIVPYFLIASGGSGSQYGNYYFSYNMGCKINFLY